MAAPRLTCSLRRHARSLALLLVALATGASACVGEACDQPLELVVDIDDLLVPGSGDLRGIARTPARLVAVGSGGTVVARELGSDWTLIDSGTTADLEAVHRWGGRMTAVGRGGVVLDSSDDGLSWAPLDLGVTADLFDLTYDDDRGAIVGEGLILFTADGGQSWTAATIPDGAGVLRGVYDAGDALWAVGAGGAMLRSLDGGAGWEATVSPVTVDLWAIDYAGDTRDEGIFAVGDGGTVLRLADDGGGWQLEATALDGGDLRGLGGNSLVGRDGLVAAIVIEDGEGELTRFSVLDRDPTRGDLWAVVDDVAVGDASRASLIGVHWVMPAPDPYCR